MIRDYKYLAYLAFSAIFVFMFDRYRYAYTFDESKDFLNEALRGHGALPENAEAHFRTLAAFESIELALYIFSIVIGFVLIRTSKLVSSFTFVSGAFLAGAIVGRMFSRTEPIRIEFFQTYLIATATAAAILCATYLLKKAKRHGSN